MEFILFRSLVCVLLLKTFEQKSGILSLAKAPAGNLCEEGGSRERGPRAACPESGRHTSRGRQAAGLRSSEGAGQTLLANVPHPSPLTLSKLRELNVSPKGCEIIPFTFKGTDLDTPKSRKNWQLFSLIIMSRTAVLHLPVLCRGRTQQQISPLISYSTINFFSPQPHFPLRADS